MDAFLLKLFLSFLTGAGLVTLATAISERVSTKLGGIVAGMPSTSVVAILFINWVQGPGAAVESTQAMLFGISAATLFALVYFLSLGKFGRSFALSWLLSILAWLLIAIPAVSSSHGILLSAALFAPIFLLLFYISDYSSKPNPQAKKQRADWLELAARAVFGGAIISFAVLMSRLLGPLYGGVFGTFPAVFSSTFIILHSKHGPGFVREFMRTIYFGSFAGFVFVVGANLLMPSYGVLTGVVASYLLSIIAVAGLVFLRGLTK